MISTTKLISCMRQCTVGVREGVAVWNCVILPITLRPSSQGTFGGEELLYLLSLFFNLVFHQQSVLSVVPLQPLTVLSQLNSGASWLPTYGGRYSHIRFVLKRYSLHAFARVLRSVA